MKRSILSAFPGRPGDTLAIFSGESSAVGHPEIASAAFVDLKFNGTRPYFLIALHVIENAAIAGLPFPWGKCSLTPLEFGLQIVVLKILFRDDVAHLGTGDVNDSVFHTEDMIGIAIQSFTLDKHVEAIEIVAIEQDHSWTMCGNVFRS